MATVKTSICQALRDYAANRDNKQGNMISKGSMAGSLECGCEYCFLACKMVERGNDIETNKQHNRDASARNAEFNLEQKHLMEDQTLNPHATISGLSFSTDVHARELFVLDRKYSYMFRRNSADTCDIGADDPIFPVAKSVSGYTGSKTALRTAWSWFEKCVKEHNVLCPPLVRANGPPKLPLRILDVGSVDSDNVRLVQTENGTGYWACLSHCWGGQQPLVTTREPETLSQHLVAIQWEKLPKTFQDAIIFTRAFGIQYLWVDSLCIIQDDEDDWQTQSSQMAYIYKNSILTIAGSASSGPNQGIFRHIDPECLDSPVTDTIRHVKLDKIRTRKAIPHNAADLPLLGRCWVHQERLLSPRFLHFGRNELIWECMESLDCECGGAQYDHRLDVPKWPAFKARFHAYSLQATDWNPSLGLGAWHAVITDYSRMNLTKAEDIFPAISGLAKSVMEATGWEYVAGLWKENFIVDLIWAVESPRLASRCKPWRAPTFSWASIMSSPGNAGGHRVGYRYMNHLQQGLDHKDGWETCFYTTLVAANCVPWANDPTGRLESAYVVLQGTLIKTVLSYTESCREWNIAAIGKEPQDRDKFHMDFDFVKDTKQGPKEGDLVFCLKLVGSRKNVTYLGDEFLIWLVLRKVHELIVGLPSPSQERHDTFERIGLLASRRDDVHIDEESPASAIERGVVIKII